MLKKIAIFFLVIMLCLCSATSCVIEIDDRTEIGETSAETAPETYNSYVSIPPLADALEESMLKADNALNEIFGDKNYDGVELKVVIVEDAEQEFTVNGVTTYSRAVRQLSNLVSEKLNCRVSVLAVPYDAFLSDAQSSLDAGLFYADVVCVPQKAIGYLKNRNMIADLNELYGDVFNAECYNAAATAQSAGNNKLYGVVGNAAISPNAYTCVYLNKKVSDAYGFTSEIYEAVNNGTWTLELMLGYRSRCAEKHSDIVSIGTSDTDFFIESVFGASGMNYMSTSIGNLPTLANNGAQLDNLVAKLRGVIADASSYIAAENAHELFAQDKLLFCVDTLGNASKLNGNFTVLPMPKVDAEQEEYYTPADENAVVFCVLSSNDRTQYAVDLIRAFNEAGDMLYAGLTRDYLDHVLRNEESYRYIEDILKAPVYDFAYMYGDSYASVAASSYEALKQAVTTKLQYSYYTGRQAYALKNDLKKIFS
ncbi:MAG: hypothetical protein IKU48_01735 [Clostridia bacterium]|nr:hypothetical protein [Clostridia bacterium]